jgi:hypothetical protein
MPADSERSEEHGLSRRQVLARGAVAAGVVWAAPVIRTATAYATSAAGTERPCTNFYTVCIDPLGVRPVRFPANLHGYDDISADAAASVSTTTSTSTTSTSTTSTSTSTTSTSTTTTTTAPPPPSDPAAAAKAADNAAAEAAASTTTAPPVDDLGLFPDTTTTTTPAPGAPPAAPVDPHQAELAAAQGAQAAGTPDNIPPGIKDWLSRNPDVPVRYPDVLPELTQTNDEAWAVTLAEVDGPDPLTHQCRAVQGWAQCRGKYAEFYVDPNPADSSDAGRRLIFPNPLADHLNSDPAALIENLIFVYCCPQ